MVKPTLRFDLSLKTKFDNLLFPGVLTREQNDRPLNHVRNAGNMK